MIGKPEWFCPRKFGWGLGIAKKEGILYIVIAAALISAAAALPLAPNYKLALVGGLFALVTVDILHMMTKVYANLDEREERHQAMAERNSSFAAIAGLVAYILYLFWQYGFRNNAVPLEMIALPICILAIMALVKGVTLIYLEREG